MRKRNYRKLLKSGNKAQLEKLKKYKHKSGFDAVSVDAAFNGIVEEFEELSIEVRHRDRSGFKSRSMDKIREEAADVANYAHMIILACDRKISK